MVVSVYDASVSPDPTEVFVSSHTFSLLFSERKYFSRLGLFYCYNDCSHVLKHD